MKYLVLDVETGGLDSTIHSLLSASFLIVDKAGQVIDTLELFIRPDGLQGRGLYTVCAEAMGVNKINLVEHDKIAVTMDKAKNLLWSFLKKHAEVTIKKLDPVVFTESYDKEIQHLIPLGQNVAGDIRFIKAKLCPEWEHYVSYRVVDTAGIARFLMDCGVLKTVDGKGGLNSLCKTFGIEYAAHTATGDAEATAKVYFKMKELVNASQADSEDGGRSRRIEECLRAGHSILCREGVESEQST